MCEGGDVAWSAEGGAATVVKFAGCWYVIPGAFDWCGVVESAFTTDEIKAALVDAALFAVDNGDAGEAPGSGSFMESMVLDEVAVVTSASLEQRRRQISAAVESAGQEISAAIDKLSTTLKASNLTPPDPQEIRAALSRISADIHDKIHDQDDQAQDQAQDTP